jgi:hypothetical protein
MLPKLLQQLLDMGDRASDAPLHRLSPREREVLVLLGHGWSNAQSAASCSSARTPSAPISRTSCRRCRCTSSSSPPPSPCSTAGHLAARTQRSWPFKRLEDSRVLAALQQLAPDQREVLLLRTVSGLTAPEVAAAVGKTTGAVKALQHRGLASLARVLGPPSPQEPPDPPPPSPDPAHLRSQEEQEA